jgi:hypothetical protein
MKIKKAKKKERSPVETVSAEESLKRMATFTERKEKFIATIKKSKDRDLPADVE